MKNIKHKKSIAWFGLLLLAPIVLLLASCSGVSNGSIIVANFESYIAPKLEAELISNNNVDYKSFSSNEQAKREFNTNHNISIPSSYVAIELIREHKVQAIDWPSITNGRISNATDALPYFTPSVQKLLKSYDLDGDGVEDNLLNWTVPYFGMDLVIGYKANTAFLDGLTINDAIQKIGVNTGKGKQFNRISMVDDTRTMYGLANRVVVNTVNPSKSTESINDFNEDFLPLKDYLGNDKVLFNTDGGIMVNDFAADNGSDVLIGYDGDLLYATYGGDSGIEPSKTMQVYRPHGTSITQALELVIVNKNLYSGLDLDNQTNVWDIMRKLTFDLPPEMLNHNQKVNWDESWSYKNFDYVNYNPIIYGLRYYILETYEFNVLQKKIFEIGPLTKNLIDDVITNEQQFNMQYAYMEMKSKM